MIDYLAASYDILGVPQGAPAPVSDAARQQAEQTFTDMCATCHGADGRDNTKFSACFNPLLPDLTQYTLNAARAFEVITNGYPGTLMVAFPEVSEDVRWALADRVQSFYVP